MLQTGTILDTGGWCVNLITNLITSHITCMKLVINLILRLLAQQLKMPRVAPVGALLVRKCEGPSTPLPTCPCCCSTRLPSPGPPFQRPRHTRPGLPPDRRICPPHRRICPQRVCHVLRVERARQRISPPLQLPSRQET